MKEAVSRGIASMNGGLLSMNYAGYLADVGRRMTEQGFAPVSLPADLGGARLALVFDRQESWGRLLIALAGKLNCTEVGERESIVAAAGAWLRSLQRGEQACHLILVFPFDRRVKEEESAAILKHRQDDPHRRWSMIPWVADLEVELLDRHSGFPPVPAEVARALTEVPRGRVEEVVRRSTGPHLGRSPFALDLGYLPATRIILAATVGYYLWTVMMGGGLLGGLGGIMGGPDSATLVRWGANYSKFVFAGEQWRLGSYMLLHGGLLHLGMNMWAFWSLGQHVELVFGTRRMLFIYIVAGVAGGIASAALRAGPVLSVGASGAVLGMLGALIYFGRSFRDRPINWHGLWGPVAINLLFGFFMRGIDNQAHIGGFLGGLLAAFLAGVPGERPPWRVAAMGVLGIALSLVLLGVIPLPHVVPGR